MRGLAVAAVVMCSRCPGPADPGAGLGASANAVLSSGTPDQVGNVDSLRLQGSSLVALVRFDQAGILRTVKQGALRSAKLRLVITPDTSPATVTPVSATRVRRYWGEANATWNCAEAPCTVLWNGGDLESVESGRSGAVDASGRIEIDVTADVQAFLAGTAPNFGWELRLANPAAAPLAFESRGCNVALGPQLVLDYDATAPVNLVRVAANHWSFEWSATGAPFVPTGVNYDHDNSLAPCPLLIEEYWNDHWEAVERSLQAIHDLGFHVVRIHLQLPAFMRALNTPNEANLIKLDQLVRAAQRHGLVLDLTGLGNYRRELVPAWFAALDDQATMDAEALFWMVIAWRYPYEPAVFSYDLQNEPFVSSGDTDQVVSPAYGLCDPDGAGPLPPAGFSYVHNHFRHAGARWTAWVQARYVTEAALTQAWPDYPRGGESWSDIGRPNYFSSPARSADSWLFAHQMGRLWTQRMVAAVRTFDPAHLVTVGMAHPLPFEDQNAVSANEPFFYGSFTPYYLADVLDFMSVHVYPRRYGSADNEPLSEMTLRAAWVGKPVILEETFQYLSDQPTYQRFMSRALGSAAGWYSFYWGLTPDQLRATGDPIGAAIAGWIDDNAAFARAVPAAGVPRTPATSTVPASLQTLLLSQSARLALSSQYAAEAALDHYQDPVVGP